MTLSDRSMSGKTCLVTGANSGIGLVTARTLAQRGAKVIVVARDHEKCAAVTRDMIDQTGNPDVSFLIADLASQADIRKLAAEVEQRHERLDVLVNNAGAFFADRLQSPDGLEMTFALNHLAYFHLTNLLLDLLKRSAPSRIVNVSSEAHRVHKLDFDDLQGERSFSGVRAYNRSKLANLLFTYELARRLEGSGVTVNALHPGFVNTAIFDGNGRIGWWLRAAARFAAISPEKGAQTSIHVASAPEVEGVAGVYFMNSKPAKSSSASHSRSAADRLWKISAELLGLPDS